MGWIEINDQFSVYSVREDFVQFFDWLIYLMQTFTLYFYMAIVLIFIAVIIISIMTRLEVFAKKVVRK
jgi:hypothetical protein